MVPACASTIASAMVRPETGPGRLLGDGGRGAEEPFEELVGVLAADADARVDHVDLGDAVVQSQHHADAPSDGRELDRVGQQVVHRLTEAVAVAVHRHGGARRLHRDGQLRLLGTRPGRLDRLADHPFEVDLRRPDREPGLLDRHQGEEVVDQPQLALCAAHDHREEPLALRAELLEVGHQLAVADHRGERRAQLVGDRCEELVLHPVGLLLHPAAFGDVAHGSGDQQALVGLQRGQAHLDRELGAVLATGRTGRRPAPSGRARGSVT